MKRRMTKMNRTSTDPLRYKLVKDLASIVSVFEKYAGHEVGVADISKSINMLPSKTSRLLRSLESEGFFVKNPDSGKYRIGPKFLGLGLLYLSSHPLRKIILPHLEYMAKELGLSTGWGIFQDDKVIVVDRFHSLKKSLTSRVGLNVPLHSSSYGKLFLAFLPTQEQERLLGSIDFIKFTTLTISGVKQLREQIEMIKEKGYAVDEGEMAIDMVGIAAPIFSSDGEVVAALSASAAKDNLKNIVLRRAVEHLTERAFFISRQIGYDIPA